MLFLNPALLVAVLFLYGRRDERVKEMLYGTAAASLVLVVLSLAGRLNPTSLVKFSEVTIFIFLVVSRTRLFLTPAETGRRIFVFNLVGLLLGLSPIFLWPIMLLAGTQPPELGGIYTFLPFISVFLLIWLVLTINDYFFHPTLVLSGLIAANLIYVSRQLAGVAKTFVHDYYHLYSVVLLVPDHPYTRMWWYTTVDFILQPAFGASIILLLLIGPTISTVRREIAAYRSHPWQSGPAERVKKAAARAYQRRQGFFALCVLLILTLAIFADLPADAAIKTGLVRAPIANGYALVAETNPFTKLERDRIAKYYVKIRGQKVVFAVLKTDESYKAALDACSICGPGSGYSQTDGKTLKCGVCGAVLPLSSFGDGGGCNPIPLRAQQQPSGLTIKLSELGKRFKGAGGNAR